MELSKTDNKVIGTFLEADIHGRVFRSIEACLKYYGITDRQRIQVTEYVAIYADYDNWSLLDTTLMLWCNMGSCVHPVHEEVCLERLANGDGFCWEKCRCEYSINRLRRLFDNNRKLNETLLKAHHDWVIWKAKGKIAAVVAPTPTRKRFQEINWDDKLRRRYRCKYCGGVFVGRTTFGLTYHVDDDCGGTADDLVKIEE